MPGFEVIFMDAGQGDCTLIVYPDGSLTLVDCGSTKGASGADGAMIAINAVLTRYMQQKTRKPTVIESLVLTHPDEDHYNQLCHLDGVTFDQIHYGGDAELYKNKKDNDYTYNLITHHMKSEAPPNTFSAIRNKNLSRAAVEVTILAANAMGNAQGRAGAIKNGNSIVLLVEYGNCKIFLMGDASAETEKRILAAFNAAKTSQKLARGDAEFVVLKMGHHGSDTSTSKEWVTAIQPDILVVSSGTKRFRGKGMPTKYHLDRTMDRCNLKEMGDMQQQTYVVFDQANKEFVARGPTRKSVWTTCYNIAHIPLLNKYCESGQTWYFGVDEQKNKTFNYWTGFTGFEDDDDMH